MLCSMEGFAEGHPGSSPDLTAKLFVKWGQMAGSLLVP